MRAASARSTIAPFRWRRAKWTRPNPEARSLCIRRGPRFRMARRASSSLWSSPPQQATRVPAAAGRDVYGELKNLVVWVKDNAGMGALYRSQHELVFVFKRGRQGHRNNVQLGQFGRNRSNIWRYPGAGSFGRRGEE